MHMQDLGLVTQRDTDLVFGALVPSQGLVENYNSIL